MSKEFRMKLEKLFDVLGEILGKLRLDVIDPVQVKGKPDGETLRS